MALTHAYNSYRKWSTVKMAAEEDDEDIWDSWEDVADSGELERRMEEREKQVREKDEKASTSQKSHENKTNSPVMMQEDTSRTLYKPQLRILKRPDSGGTNQGNSQEGAKGKPVHKSLAERQAQYAEARARIMGNASDESNDSEKSEMPRAIQVEQKLPDNVIRLPRGPNDDGSKGFEVSR